MSRLVLYENRLLFDKEVKSKLSYKIGSGSEGVCYDHKGYAYKILFDKKEINDTCGILDYMENPSNILTVEDVDLPSFAFPKEIYATKNWLLGYKSRLIKNDLFDVKNLNSSNDLTKINFNNLAHAYKVMLEDVDLLSKEKIKIYDLTFNLIFDGKKLTAIDTCGYERVKDDVMQDNRDCLATSIEDLFHVISDYEIKEQIKNDDIDSYLDRVNKQLCLKK